METKVPTLPQHLQQTMEAVEEVVIVGAGLAGLATALGLHRKGFRSLVLESSASLRAAGFAFVTWTNAWKALDALGVADSLRKQHTCLDGFVSVSASSGDVNATLPFNEQGSVGKSEVRCVKRNLLLQTLVKELPEGTIRYSSKIVSIEDEGQLKLLYLADGSTLKTKVLVGCDGVNSVVAKFLGLKAPSSVGRSATRGFSEYPDGHGFKNEFLQYYGEGFRAGLLPCDERSIYWFFTWAPSPQDKEMEVNSEKMAQFVLRKLRLSKVPEKVAQVVEKSDTSGMLSSPLKFRWPHELIWGNISKNNVCVAGDALHPMTPDLGQGGCSALEDGVILARCLGDAILKEHEGDAEEEHKRINSALEMYAKHRRWRGINLIVTSYISGYVQESDGVIWSVLRDKCLSRTMARWLLKKADFDCGKL